MARETYREIHVSLENVETDEVVDLQVTLKNFDDSGWEIFGWCPLHDPDDKIPDWVIEETIEDEIKRHGGYESYKNQFEIYHS